MEREVSTIQVLIGKDFPIKVVPLIREAKKSIEIIVFDWRIYPGQLGNATQAFNEAIVSAHRRGVQVRAITNSRDIVAMLKKVGIKAKKPITPKLIHIKLLVIDDRFFVLGSHNYTASAFQMNYELSVILDDPANKKEITDFFNNLWKIY